MSAIVSYKKFGFIPVTVLWFNTDNVLKHDSKSWFYILRQSRQLEGMDNLWCAKQYRSTTSIIDMTQTEDELWKSLDPKSCRYEIRKVLKMLDSGQDVQVKSEDDLNAFLAMANNYIKTKGYSKPLSMNHLTRYLDSGQGDLFTIYKDGEMVGGNLYLRDVSSRVRLLYSFNNRFDSKEKQKISGPLMRYLHWYTITKIYQPMGVCNYDFGGVNLDRNASTYGISKFKLSFGGQVREEWNYVFVRSKLISGIYSFLQKIRN